MSEPNLEPLFEVVRIKQEIHEVSIPFASYKIHSPADVADICTHYIGNEDREVFLVLALSIKNEVLAVHRCHVGSLNASVVSPREVMKSLILNNAGSFVISHNHPSGNPEPSQEDFQVTNRLYEAGKLLQIPLLDHVIVTHDRDVNTSIKNQMPHLFD